MRVITHSWIRLVVIIPLIALILIFSVSGLTHARTNTYSNTAPGGRQRISNGSQNYTFTVPPTGAGSFATGSTIGDVNITVTFLRTNSNTSCNQIGGNPNQIYISLRSPQNTTVQLVQSGPPNNTYGTGGTVNQVSVTFDDAGPAIPANSMPATGTYHPSGNLANFNNQNPTGTWTLTVGDQDWTGGATCYVSSSLEIKAYTNPTAIDHTYTVEAGGTLNVNTATGLLSGANDPNGDALIAVQEPGGTPHGTLTINNDGSFIYIPEAGFSGTATFHYRARNAENANYQSTPQLVTITVTDSNAPPVAVDDNYSTDEDTALTIDAPGVLGNDTDADGDTLTAVIPPASDPVYGTLVLNANGSFTYTPDPDYAGSDSFTYYATDGTANSLTPATVNIMVNPINDPPVANDDDYTIEEDGTLTANLPGVLGNDTDADGDTLTAVIPPATDPAHGTLALNADGSFTYTPDPDYAGSDSFTYTVNDGTVDSVLPATVNITVDPVNDVPFAADDTYNTDEDTALTIDAPGVLGNDTDADGDTLTAVLPPSNPTHGTLALNADGSFTYTPATNYYGPDSFTYTVTDGTANSVLPATVIINVDQVNVAPVAVDDTYDANEDTTLTIDAPGVLSNDTDANTGDILTSILVDDPIHGTLNLAADGSFDYTPEENYVGPDSFTYYANDGTADSNTATVMINVTAVNDPPAAVDDTYELAEDSTYGSPPPTPPCTGNLGVLSNDTDQEGDALTAVLVAGTNHGVFTLGCDGTISYTPEENFYGTDSATYIANDGAADSNVATVSFTVTPLPDPPAATADFYTTNEDTPLIVVVSAGVLINDTDADGDTLTAILAAGPAHGTLDLAATGDFTYTPAENYNGSDSFTYRASDGTSETTDTTVSILIGAVNDLPVAVDDGYSTPEDTPLSIAAPGVLGNDTDADGDALSAAVFGESVGGTVILESTGAFVFTPTLDFSGMASFSYTALDGIGGSNIATVHIDVGGENDPPVALGETYETDEDVPLAVAAPGLLANDFDPDGNTISPVLVTGPTAGTLDLPADGSFTYTPAENFSGSDGFTYYVTDGVLNSGNVNVTITINAVNDAPAAVDDTFFTDEDTPLVTTTSVLDNDSDAEGSPLSASWVTEPSHGTLTIFNTNGTFSYTPNEGFGGIDQFTYVANDGTTNSAPATVTITVSSISDPPTADNETYSTNEDTALTVNAANGVLVGDTDPDGDTLTAVLASSPTHGSLALNSDGSFTYTPTANYFGSDSFTYYANDGILNSNAATVTITVTAVNDPPVAVANNYSTRPNTRLDIAAPGVLDNDTDPEGSPLTAVLGTGPAHGTLNLNANGSFRYTPTSGYIGTDTFTYYARDGALNSVTPATVTITIASAPPVAQNDSYTPAGKNTPLEIPAPGVLENDYDPDGGDIEAVLATGPAHGSVELAANGSFVYIPVTGYSGTDTFTYYANDGQTNSVNPATVSITVVNSPPTANDDGPYDVPKDMELEVPADWGVLSTDWDNDGDPLTAEVAPGGDPIHGTLILYADGSFVYLPDTNYVGMDVFTYYANDGEATSEATVTITVYNNPPTANNDNFYETEEDTPLSIPSSWGVLANDWDMDGNNISAVLNSDPAHGTVTLDSNGAFIYTPDENYFGSDTFTYYANDGALNSLNAATVTITVYSVDDLPVANDDTYSTPASTTLNVPAPGVLGNDTDGDGNNTLTATLVVDATYGDLTLNSNGSFTYTPLTGFNGEDNFIYYATDGMEASPATVTITVGGNVPPVANNDAYSTDENTALTIAAPGVLANDTDANGNTLTAVIPPASNPAHGTLTLNSNGSFTYTPATGYSGPDSFTYYARDGVVNSTTPATVTITVNEGNVPPVANNDAYSTDQDTMLTIGTPGVLANDTDGDGDALLAILSDSPDNGSITLRSNGSFDYTPYTGFIGTDSFSYMANDGTANSNVATVSITVGSANHAPTADDDAYSIDEDTTLTVPADGVLDGDEDLDSDPLTAIMVSGPTHGTLDLESDGSFIYTPAENYSGSDSFTYVANDGTANSNTATVTITVNSINDPPVAVDNSYSTGENTMLTITAPGVLAGDSDIDSIAFTAALVTGPSNGSVTLNADGSFSYTPATDYTGPDSFTYQADDGIDTSNVATVNITVNAVNHAPTATNDAYVVAENGTLNIAAPGVLGNDNDFEGSPLTAFLVDNVLQGTLVLNGNGSFTYTPTADYTGPDSFTYYASDGAANSETVTVSITVSGENVPPIAVDDNYSVDEDTTLNIGIPGVLGNDIDTDSLAFTAVLVTNPAHGSLNLLADGSFSYTPAENYNGPDSFTYQGDDGLALGNVGTVNITVNPVNDAPSATDDTYSTGEDVPLDIAAPGVLGNDSDIDSATLSAIMVSGPAHGALALETDGSFLYEPSTGYSGPDSFTYRVNDGAADSNTATVNITISSENDPPVPQNDSYSVNEDETLTITAPGVLGNDNDPEGSTLTANLAGGPAHGTLALNGDGSFTYTPAANYNGADSFTYRANDGTTDSNPAVVNITVNAANDAPTATDDNYSTGEDAPLTIGAPGVLGNDTDIDGGTLSAVRVSNPAHGTLTLNANGSFTYTPAAGYNGADSFTYYASDGTANSNTATVNLTVSSENDPPVTQNDNYSTGEDVPLNIAAPGVLGNDSDPEGSALTASLVSGPAHGTLTLNSNGSFSYTPAANYTGLDNFTYRASDGTNQNNATATINVGALNDAPQANNDTYTATQNQPLTINTPGVLGNDTDPEGNPLTAVLATNPGHGTLTLNVNGSFTYTPSQDFTGADSFTYTASDGAAQSPAATVVINVGAGQQNPGGGSGPVPDTLHIVAQGQPYVIYDLGSGPDGTLYQIVSWGQPLHGTLEVVADHLVYTPEPGYSGEDYFPYEVIDSVSGYHGMANARIVIWKPVPTCRGFNGSNSDATIYATLNDGDVIGPVEVYCRTVVANGEYVRNGGEIGIQSVLDLGVIQAVEIFGLTSDGGQSYVGLSAGATICLKGTGHLIFLDAAGIPRVPTWLESWPANGFTCANLASTGTLVLVP